MWIIIILALIIGVFWFLGNTNNQKGYTEIEAMAMAKRETDLIASKLGKISQIPDLSSRAKEYRRVRQEVLSRKNEPIGKLLQAVFNTCTDTDRNLIESIYAD